MLGRLFFNEHRFSRSLVSQFSVVKSTTATSAVIQSNFPSTLASSNTASKVFSSRPEYERQYQRRNHKGQRQPGTRIISPRLKFKDERLPCSQHLDPKGTILPRNEWIHVNGTLPICSLDEVISSFEKMLKREESECGIVDLEAPWNPLQDENVPTHSLDPSTPIIEAAHVVISPFGRPNGWYLKFSNRSLVNTILTRSQQNHIHVTWKVVQIKEHEYDKETALQEDPAHANGFVVDDTMVRIENCPYGLLEEEIRLRLSRYDLAPKGKTVIRWEGETNDGKKAPLMYVVRFASAAWARAAIREVQSLRLNGKIVKLVQYPKQMRYEENESES